MVIKLTSAKRKNRDDTALKTSVSQTIGRINAENDKRAQLNGVNIEEIEAELPDLMVYYVRPGADLSAFKDSDILIEVGDLSG